MRTVFLSLFLSTMITNVGLARDCSVKGIELTSAGELSLRCATEVEGISGFHIGFNGESPEVVANCRRFALLANANPFTYKLQIREKRAEPGLVESCQLTVGSGFR